MREALTGRRPGVPRRPSSETTGEQPSSRGSQISRSIDPLSDPCPHALDFIGERRGDRRCPSRAQPSRSCNPRRGLRHTLTSKMGFRGSSRSVRKRLAPFRQTQLDGAGCLAGSHREHGPVVAAIIEGDGRRAGEMMPAHIRLVRDAYTTMMPLRGLADTAGRGRALRHRLQIGAPAAVAGDVGRIRHGNRLDEKPGR
jgi:hypothetical protein